MHSLEAEFTHGVRYPNRGAAPEAVWEYIETCYGTVRRYGALGRYIPAQIRHPHVD